MSALDPFVCHLHAHGRLRVWSVLVTVFGDVIQPRGGVARTGELIEIMSLLEVEAGAVRTALSRLSSDGWVQSARQGRTSTYALTDEGKAAFLPATQRIYDPLFVSTDPNWRLDLGSEGPGFEVRGAKLLPGCSDAPVPMKALSITGAPSALPSWVTDEALPGELTQGYSALATLLETLDTSGLTPLDRTALRVLLIHPWRRLILRHPRLPRGLVPNEWPGVRAHALLKVHYRTLAQDDPGAAARFT
ncbi:PaaX family transcriptional regulator C-terminal domain-containing protein [Pseudaestuariivita sp.]|uniref:PaaX family transcriptional regulator C-terminal domain-containing protein n=1 Tax=Pseudaestuariivita sp. TaxID=2211669 RepID=UPI0040582AA4